MNSSSADALDADGFVVVPHVLSAARIADMLAAFSSSTDTSGTQHVDVDVDECVPGFQAWNALAGLAPVIEAATHILGNAPFATRVHGRNPLPGFGLQGLHSDWRPREPGEPFFTVTAIFMLDAFTLDNGATRVVPGTHLIARPIPASYAQPGAHHPRERIVTGTAGSMLLFNGHLWHSGTRNDTTAPRRAAQLSLSAAGRAN